MRKLALIALLVVSFASIVIRVSADDSASADGVASVFVYPAACTGDLDSVVKYVQAYPSLLKGPVGKTLLPMAVFNKHSEIARYLVDSGADINATDSVTGRTALDWAQRREDRELAEWLRTKGAKYSTTFGLVLSDQNGWTEYPKQKGKNKPAFGNGKYVAKLKNFRWYTVEQVEISCDWLDAKGKLVGHGSTNVYGIEPNTARFVTVEAYGIPFPKSFTAKAAEDTGYSF